MALGFPHYERYWKDGILVDITSLTRSYQPLVRHMQLAL